MTKRKSKHLLSLLLLLAMVLTLTVPSVFAADSDVDENNATSVETVGETIETLDATGEIQEVAEETTVVAKIGDTEYDTLAGAINAATSGQTVTLVGDVTLSETINIYKSITLDLGSYTITSTATGKAIYTTQTLTIKADGGGITSTGYAILNQKGSGTGTLTIEGGTYSSSADHAIYNLNGTVTVESGTISTTYSEKAGIYNTSGGTVNVNGGSVSGVKYGIYSGGTVNITEGTVTGTAESSSYGVYLASGATATISGGTIKGYEGLRQYTGSSEVSAVSEEGAAVDVVISSGTFEGVTHAVNVCTTATISGGTFTATGTKDQYAVALYSTGATVTVSGGTFSGMYSTAWINSSAGGSITVADGYFVNEGSLTDSNSGDTALVRTVAFAVAKIGSTCYASLAEAVEAANSGDTVILLDNVELDSYLAVGSSANVTLDLNGKTINQSDDFDTSSGNYLFRITGVLTIEDNTGNDGKISMSNGYGIVVVGNSASLTVTSGTISNSSGRALEAEDSATISVSGGIISGTYGLYAYEKNTVTVSGGSISGTTTGLRIASGSTLNLSDCTVSSGKYGVYVYGESSVANISGGTITASNYGVYIQGGSVNLSGDVEIKVQTNSSYYSGVYLSDGKAEFVMSGGTISGGYYGIYINRNSSASAEISDGYISGYKKAAEINALGSISVSGGYYSSDVINFCSSEKSCEALENEVKNCSYQVVDATENNAAVSVTSSNESSVTYFGSLASAVNSASSGDTLTVLKDIDLGNYDTFVTIKESLTIDLNGHTIEGKSTAGTTVGILDVDGSEVVLTLKDSSQIGGGEVTNNYKYAGRAIRLLNSASLIINDVKISGGYYTLQTSGGSAVTLNSGSITNEKDREAIDLYGSNTSLTINGGTISGEYGIYQTGTGTITLNGGTIEGTGTNGYGYGIRVGGTLIVPSDSTVTVRGVKAAMSVSSSSVFIAGGHFSSEVSIDYCTDGYIPYTEENGSDYATAGVPYTVQAFILGISDSENSTVGASVASGYGESVMYTLVSSDNIKAYDTDSYPTTRLTFTGDDGEAHDYIFAGWYSYSDGIYTAMTSFPTGEAYAKFVDANVLTVKGIVTYGSAENNDEGTGYWRFATGLDSFNYNYIGFEVKLGDATEATELVGKIYTKYTVTSADNYVFQPSMFGSSTDIATNVISDISATTCTVRAYWITMDGTSVYSSWYSYSIPASGYELTETSVDE